MEWVCCGLGSEWTNGVVSTTAPRLLEPDNISGCQGTSNFGNAANAVIRGGGLVLVFLQSLSILLSLLTR
jgi:hypothetical protein